jgi:hypothetical protein
MDYFKAAQSDEDYEASGAIQVGMKSGPDAEEARWGLILTVFFRVVAMLWIVQGLEQWRQIVAPASGSFLDLSPAGVSATIFFAVLNPIAAVGLWLVAPWGGVVWLLTLLAQIFVASIKPSFFIGGAAIKWLDGALLTAYLLLSWRANVASGDIGPIDHLIEWAVGKLRRRGRDPSAEL